MNSPHEGPVTRKMFPFDDVIMHKQHVLEGLTLYDAQFSWNVCSGLFICINNRDIEGLLINLQIFKLVETYICYGLSEDGHWASFANVD